MCAIIGIVLNNPTRDQFNMIQKVFIESKLRGLHATGISWTRGGKLNTIKEPIPAELFVQRYMKNLDEFVSGSSLRMIGHCRYSTSDLLYNQPISNERISVAHNGVISQELPERWKELYGYDCSTKNDSELLLHTIAAGKCPLEDWRESSVAAVELHSDETFRFYRNGKRPMYLTKFPNGILVTSTSDVVKRAGATENPDKMPMNTYHTYDSNFNFKIEKVDVYGEVDYQI